MPNLKVQTTAWPEGGYKQHGPEGMEPVKPQLMSRIEYAAVKKKIENTVRPGGVCFTELNQLRKELGV